MISVQEQAITPMLYGANCFALLSGRDIVNMDITGHDPVLFDGNTLPFRTRGFSQGVLFFVLQYCSQPECLLKELRRVISKRLFILQSTYKGDFDHNVLSVREYFQGRLAFQIASKFGLLGNCANSLSGVNLIQRDELRQIINTSGWEILHERASSLALTGVRREFLILGNR